MTVARQSVASGLKHPLLLLDVPYTFEVTHSSSQRAPAWVSVEKQQVKYGRQVKRSGRAVYHIAIAAVTAQEMYKKHPFNNTNQKGRYTYNDWLVGLLAHEISHILTGALLVEHPYEDDIYQQISNIIDDSHDEYWMQRNFPMYSPYINAALLGLKYVSGFIENEASPLARHLNALFHMVRFGHFHKDADPRFRDFAYPLIKSSIRGSRENARDATVAIYEWLRATHEGKSHEWEVGSNSFHGGQPLSVSGMTKAELDAIAQDLAQEGQGDLPATAELLQEFSRKGKLPGIGEAPITIEEKGSDFYHSTLSQYGDVVMALRKAFLQKFDVTRRYPTFEGELNLAQQQRAYVDSLVGDESRVYHVNKKLLPDKKVIVFRDISSSTSDFEIPYAQAAIIFHAALDGIAGIQTANIDFCSGAALSFGFDEEIAMSRIHPESRGNTYLMPAIEIAKTLDLRARGGVINIVITDGAISSPNECEDALTALGDTWFIEITPPGGKSDGYVQQFEHNLSCTLVDLPYEMVDRLA